MFRHNLLLIYRNFRRFKSTFAINLIGLSSGITCALLIYLWVHDELSFDKFHANDRQLYQVMENQHHEGDIMTTDGTAGLLAEALKAEMPEVEYAAAVTPTSWFPGFVVSARPEEKLKATGQFAGKDFFNIFSYGLIAGNKDQVLTDKNSMVISESLAHRLFGTTENIVGKSVEWQMEDQKRQVLVSGVFKDVPHNSSSQFDFVLPFETYKEINPEVIDWGNYGCKTYLVLKSGTDISRFNTKIAHAVDKRKDGNAYRTLFIAPYADGYLYGNYKNGVQAGGRIEYVKLFSIIAVFVLAIACINFINLSTAKATTRLKEVGVKKAVGADRKALIMQYMGESMAVSLIALMIAIILIIIFLPRFNDITQKQIMLRPGWEVVTSFLAITLLTGVVAGGYPALYLSGFNPVAVLKGRIKASAGELFARKGLVVFQFATSIILIVAVLIVYKQIEFVQSKNVGYNRDNIVYFQKEGAIAENLDPFLAEVKNIPGVVNASSMEDVIVGTHSTTVGVDWNGKSASDVVKFENVTVNYDMIETLGVTMKEGRAFSRKFSTDSSAIIFNEAAIKVMKLTNPVGQTIKLWGKDRMIVGVARNFNFLSLHEDVKPLFFKVNPAGTTNVMVKIAGGDERRVIDQIAEIYHRFNPNYTFNSRFLDADYQAQYVSEKRVQALSQYFAFLAILISCLGLFGLAAFTAQRRLKEIGIRKVLGSGFVNIVILLTKDFTKLVLLSIAIALPISYLISRSWLDGFAFHIKLTIWYFLGAGVIAILTAWITVGMQAVKAARVNPLKCLKDE
ncbi:ABC transporter permease [Chitinophaga varians]|uniref:ABC transporter permease n=1 Tax=Chitinophaga varians TaxID=2202339 RepID=UPI00165F51EE|nr:ABC transporter permease [Chitinophaga varians]MBC9913422.1 ABC transporter permease [Chitinophaga varians]